MVVDGSAFSILHASEVVRLCNVAAEQVNEIHLAATPTERMERGRIARNAILRVREIAERFTQKTKDDEVEWDGN